MTDPTPPTTGADDMREALAPTPSTDEIRYRVEHDWEPYGDGSFDRWLAAHVAAVVAESQEHARAEWSSLRSEVERLTREATAQSLNAICFKNERDQALGVVAAVNALVESARQRSMRGEPGSASDLGLSILDALAPVSGAVEGAGGDEAACTCEHYVVDYSDPERYHPSNIDVEDDPTCPRHHPTPVAEHEREVRAEEVRAVLERLIELRRDYLPGLTWDQMPHIDLIGHEINTVEWVLRILTGGDARGWAHSSRWNQLDGLDVLAARTPEAGS